MTADEQRIEETAARTANALQALLDAARRVAADRDAAKAHADKLAQLLTVAAAVASAYLDQRRTPELRTEACALLDAIREL